MIGLSENSQQHCSFNGDVYPFFKRVSMPHKYNEACGDHGGKRSGCGRKPGVKTQPIRLPAWLLEQLSAQGDPRQLIIDACLLQHPSICNEGLENND